MEIYNALNEVSDYIEENLEGTISFAKIAKLLGCNEDLASRFFALLTGTSLKEYIRSRRLTLAAKYILEGRKCMDVALLCGYEQEASFGRAFKKQHGITPSECRGKKLNLHLQQKFHFQVDKQGLKTIDVKLKKLPAQDFYGIKKEVDINKIPPVAKLLWKEVKQKELKGEKNLVGITMHEVGKCYYCCCSSKPKSSLTKIHCPKGLWISLSTASKDGRKIKEKIQQIYKESYLNLAPIEQVQMELELYQEEGVECLVYVS